MSQLPGWSSIRYMTITWILIVAKARIVVISQLNLLVHDAEKRVHVTPSVVSKAALDMAFAQGNSPLVEDEMDVACRGPIEVNVLGACAFGIHRGRGLDDFNVEAAGKRLEVGEDELTVVLDVGCGEGVVELGEAKGNEDAEDAGVVAEVEVEGLVNGKCDRVVVQCHVDLGRGRSDDVVLHTGEDFFDVAYSIWLVGS